MKAISMLLFALLAGGCTAPKENYQQAYETDLTYGRVMMRVLRTLDTGDIRKARRLGMTSMHVTLYSLSDYAAQAHPTAEQRQEVLSFARDVLDFMLAHREEFDPRLPSVRTGLRGLQRILTESEDVRRLTELSDYLAGIEKKMSETAKP